MGNSQPNNLNKINVNVQYSNNINNNSLNSLSQALATKINSCTERSPLTKYPNYTELGIGGRQNDNFMKLDKYSIKSETNNNKNALLLIETIKYILIEKNIVTKEEFDKIYNMKEEELNDKINGETIMRKLIDNDDNDNVPRWG